MQLALTVLAFLVAFASASSERAATDPLKMVGLAVTSTYTQTITCTKSVAKACAAGRRRREVLAEDDFSPSAVLGVEATSKIEDETRTLDSYLLPIEFSPQEIESAIDNNVERQDRAAVTFPVATFSAFLQISLLVRTVTPACSAPGKSFQCPQL